MIGELRSAHRCITAMVAQFSRIVPHTRKARIYLYPTVEQAKLLFDVGGPFSFEATISRQEGVIESHLASEIWLDPRTQIVNAEATYWSQASGRINRLETKMIYQPGPQLESRHENYPAWFVAGRCFALQILANADEEEVAAAKEYGYSRSDIGLRLQDGAEATIRRYLQVHRRGVSREIKRSGYSIQIVGAKNPQSAKCYVDALLILASFASRERTINAHWGTETKEQWIRTWRFDYGKLPKRPTRVDPLVPRDREACRAFLQDALAVYLSSKHQALLDSAVYALLDTKQTIEVKIAHLFSGIQGALLFATQTEAKRSSVRELHHRFLKAHPDAFVGLWSLVDSRSGPPLAFFRNAIVHGDAFSENGWLALSYAVEHLRWHLERIILIALGWDFQKSNVSDIVIRRFYAHADWKVEQSRIASRTSTP